MADGWPVIQWRQVWINPNDTDLVTEIIDPIPPETTYIGGLNCEAHGTSITTKCVYDSSTNSIIWDGTLGPDAGHTTEEDALNEVIITFKVKTINSKVNEVSNKAKAFWDQNNNGKIDPDDPDVKHKAPAIAAAAVKKPQLPQTGFAPNKETILPPMPANYRYPYVGSLWLEIPRLGLSAPIVGVPKHNGQWDITWLWNQAGWLEGTAFPTWDGNTVLTGHVYLPNGKPGPFVNIHNLHWGDIIVIHAWGERFVYFVENSALIAPDDLQVLKHKDGDWVTLLTCRGYDPSQDTYRWRYAVQAKRIYWTNKPQHPLH